MDLIIGGKYQGKLNFCLNKYGFTNNDVFFANEGDMENKKVLYGFHILVKAWLKENKDVMEETKTLDFQVIITDEIGSGIIPLDAFERLWREETGRACCVLAQRAESVTRVFCGVPSVIKERKK